MRLTRQNIRRNRDKVRNIVGNIKKRIHLPKVADIFRDKKGRLLPCIKEIVRIGQLTVVRLQGSIDSSTIPNLSANINDDMKNYLDRNILLDFKDVAYVDTATLAYIIFLLDKLQKSHRKLGIINTIPILKSRFEIEKIEKLVQVYNDENKALRELG